MCGIAGISNLRHVKGALLLYNLPILNKSASTIWEHVAAFEQFSRFNIWSLNTACGFPKNLQKLHFSAIVFHYSLTGTQDYCLNDEFLDYLETCKDSYKVAFFQDEYRHCQLRFAFINHFDIDCVYTLLEPEQFDRTYRQYTNVRRLVYNIPGYVSNILVDKAHKYARPFSQRTLDVGYRGRRLPYYMGKGAQEKTDIAVRFKQLAAKLDLKLDIEVDMHHRIYGDAWYQFMANCKSVLGVEAGVSIFDLEDEARLATEKLFKTNPNMRFDEAHERILFKWEGNIPYRTISPRHFEAAAFRVCQILYEGKYSGILKPMVHYIPLSKDFSNFDEVVKLMRDPRVHQELTENAYRELISSKRYTYQTFIRGFDQILMDNQVDLNVTESEIQQVDAQLKQDIHTRMLRAYANGFVLHYQFPGRKLFIQLTKPILKPLYQKLYFQRKDNRIQRIKNTKLKRTERSDDQLD